jgi:putative Mn2+ efflux pump MntP
MSFLNLMLVAVGVSADAFAVSLTQGVRARRHLLKSALRIALAFGLFQGAMPVIGWLLGTSLAGYIAPVDHWVAFVLLLLIGGKMIWEATRPGDGNERTGRLRTRELVALAVATSVDALAVGLSFAFLDVPIGPAALLIGGITAGLAFVGVLLGHRAGVRWRAPAEIVGGVVLVGMGVKILLEHTLVG